MKFYMSMPLVTTTKVKMWYASVILEAHSCLFQSTFPSRVTIILTSIHVDLLCLFKISYKWNHVSHIYIYI